jgi:hypothetical protein
VDCHSEERERKAGRANSIADALLDLSQRSLLTFQADELSGGSNSRFTGSKM